MKYYFVVILSFLLFFSTKNINAQSLFSFKANAGSTAVGGAYSDIQAGFFFSKSEGGMIALPSSVSSICAGVETNYLFKNDFRIVPKISFDYHKTEFPISFGLQGRYYPAKDMDFSKASIQVCPHIGTNFMSIYYINFGYNFAVTNKDITPDLGFQVNFGVFFPVVFGLAFN